MTSFLAANDSKSLCSYQMVGAIGQSYKSIENSIHVVKNSSVIYFCGNCLIERDIFTSEHKYFFQEGHFTDITHIDVSLSKEDDSTLITIAETKSETTTLTIINITKNIWYCIDLKEKTTIICLKLNTKTKTIYYIEHVEKMEEHILYAWNYEKNKKIGRLPLKHRYDKIENHPFKIKSIILFSKIEVKLYEFKQQIKMFQERVHYVPISNEKNVLFCDVGFWIKKKTFLMIILAQNNTIYLFFEDNFMKKISLDLSIISFTKFRLNSNNGFAELFLFNMNSKNADENDEENAQINLVRIVSLKKYIILASDNFYLCFCKVHKHFQVDQNIGSHNLFYVHQGYHLSLQENGDKDESLFTLSSNVHGSLLTLVSKTPINSNQQPIQATQTIKKRILATTNNGKSRLGQNQDFIGNSTNLFTGSMNFRKDKRDGVKTLKQEFKYKHYLLNLNNVDLTSSPLKLFFPIGTHEDSINTVRVSRSKNIFITLGQEQGRIWDLSPATEEKQNKLLPITSKEEQYLDFDIHPFGFFLAVGTLMNLKIFAILEKKLSLIKEITNMLCTKIRYSSRAKYLVANEQHFVHCFETIHYNKLYTFTAHSKIIRDLLIVDSQNYVISYCERMQLMMWEILDRPETYEDVEKEVKLVTTVYKHESEEFYSSYVYDEKNGLLICGGTNIFIRIYADLCRVLVLKIIDPGFSVLSLAIEQTAGFLFVGTQNGCVRCYYMSSYIKFVPKQADKKKSQEVKNGSDNSVKPQEQKVSNIEGPSRQGSKNEEELVANIEISGEKQRQSTFQKKPPVFGGVEIITDENSAVVIIKLGDFHNFKVSNCGINNISVSQQNSQIIFTEEIGNIFIFNFLSNKKQAFVNPLIGTDINFVPKYKIQEEARNIKQLIAEVERLKNVKGIEKDKMKIHLETKLKMIEDKFEASLKENEKMKLRFQQKCQSTYEEDLQKYDKIKKENDAKLQNAQNNTSSILEFELQKTEELKKRNENLVKKNEQEFINLTEKHKIHLFDVQKKLDDEILSLSTEYEKLLVRLRLYNKKFLNKINLEEEDHEREIVLYAQNLKNEIAREKEGGAHFLLENENLVLQNNKEISEIYKKQKEVEDLIVENTNLMEEKVKHSLSILKMQEQLLEREKVIINKECDLKQTVDVQKSLENFRYILDRKISNFISEKNRIMNKIREKEEAIRKLFAELIQQNEFNAMISRNSSLQHNLLILLIGHEKRKSTQIQYLGIKFQSFCEKIVSFLSSESSFTKKKIDIKGLINEFEKIRFEEDDDLDVNLSGDKDSKVNGFTACIEENFRIKDDISSLLRKIDVTHKSSKGQVLFEVAKTKNLIEECNKLRQENDFYHKLLQEMVNAVDEAKVARQESPGLFMKKMQL